MKHVVFWDGRSYAGYALLGFIFLMGFAFNLFELVLPIFEFAFGLIAAVVAIVTVIFGIMEIKTRKPGDFLVSFVTTFGFAIMVLSICLDDLFGTKTKVRGFWPFKWMETTTTPAGHVANYLLAVSAIVLFSAAVLWVRSRFSSHTPNAEQRPQSTT